MQQKAKVPDVVVNYKGEEEERMHEINTMIVGLPGVTHSEFITAFPDTSTSHHWYVRMCTA